MSHKTKISDVLPTLVFAIGFITWGVVMIVKDQVAVGTNSRTLQTTGFGGHLLILIGVVFLYVTYFALSPYSRIRRFFEEGWKKKKK